MRRWTADNPPRKLLILRFHAVGDIAVTLPSCAGLRKKYPGLVIDYITSETAYGLVSASGLFDNVYEFVLGYGEQESISLNKSIYDKLKRYFKAFRWGIFFSKKKYDVVIDLQNNRLSRIIRKLSKPSSYSEFDRLSVKPAGIRALETVRAAGFDDVELNYKMKISRENLIRAQEILYENGYNGSEKLIVLNPAGLWVTRNWPLENYPALAFLLKKKHEAQFLLMGTERMTEKAAIIKSCLGESVIDLVNKTTLAESLAILHFASLVISEDSGLMHMAWASGVPTIALLGSSSSVWTKPLGAHSRTLDSSDLPCGDCMSEVCKYGDVHCLTRYTPEDVFKIAEELLSLRGE